MDNDLQQAINNIEKLIEQLINEPPEGLDINQLVRDYNVVRRAVAGKLVNKE
jgi:hypothetical protein